MTDLRLWYALPLTVVKIDGTVTVSTADSGEKVPVRTSDVSVAVQADTDNLRELVVKERWGEKHEFEVKLAQDERLAGAMSSSTGLGAQILAAGLRLATLAAKVVPGLDVPGDVLKGVPIEETLEKEQPELARRRRIYRTALSTLQAKLAELASEAARQPSPDVHERIKTTQIALTAARSEAAHLEAQFEAWRTERYPDWTRTYSYGLGVDRLPERTTAEDPLRLTEEELNEGQVGEILRALGVAVARIADKDPTDHTPKFPAEGVEFRRPRLCQLGVYEAPDGEEPGAGTPLHLRRLMPAWIVDASSDFGFIPFESGVFEEHGAGAEFGDSGTLVKLTNKSTGAAEALATAASGAGGAVVESLDQASKIAAAFPAPTDPALKALQDHVGRRELEARLATANKTITEATQAAKGAASGTSDGAG
jgi:hypothetical protein